MSISRNATAGALGLVLAGCPTRGAYTCADASDCDRGAGGVCLAGACAYDDPDCEGSGLRYSPHANERPGECVPPMVGDTSTGAETTTTTTDEESSTTGIPSCGTRRAIVLDTTLLSPTASMPGYPALVVITDAALGSEAEPDGDDIFFTDVDGAALPHEIDAFDASTGTLAAWVRLPDWTPGQELGILLRAGDPSLAPADSSAMVWEDNYAAVFHMGDALADDADMEIIRDSTSRANHGFVVGEMTAEQSVEGVVGRALVFDGIDDTIDVDADFVGQLESFTVSWWVRIDGDDSTHHPFFQRLNGILYPRCRRLIADSGGNVMCQIGLATETATLGADDSALPDGELRHFALSYDAELGLARMYASGEEAGSFQSEPGVPLAGDGTFGIGRIDEFGSMLGMLDEFRVSQRALEPEWIAADHRVQTTPANLIVEVGLPEPAPCP